MSGIRETVANYHPSKAVLFWSCAGTAVATMIIGFTWGGWVTGGSAVEMAEAQAEEARASLAADICVERFLASPEVRTNLAALKEESSYSQDNVISDAGWTTFADREDPVDGAAQLCAEQLAEVELPEVSEPVAMESDAPETPEAETTPESESNAS